MSDITTHVLDTARGRPAAGVPVTLEFHGSDGWRVAGRGSTDGEGRLRHLAAALEAGLYRLTFDVRAYNPSSFFPTVTIAFEVRDLAQHYHLPLLLSPFGYTTYRGS